jgi:hypothetical protein
MQKRESSERLISLDGPIERLSNALARPGHRTARGLGDYSFEFA